VLDLTHYPALAGLWTYWRSRCDGMRLPARAAIDPVAIPRLLPHLQFLDRVEKGEFRYRLTGTAVVASFGLDPTGRLIAEVPPAPSLAIAHKHYSQAWASGRPLWSRNKYATRGGAEKIVTRVVLPLAEDGQCVSSLLTGQIFEGVCATYERTGVDWHGRPTDAWGLLSLLHASAEQAAAVA
jgi:hypothetical protein